MKVALSSDTLAEGKRTSGMVQAAITGGTSPEEVLKLLSSYGIDWYLTEKGALLIRYWQIGAEDFIPIERVAELREGGKMYPESNALEWVSKNLDFLRSRYPGKWIAVVGDRVDCVADNLPSLMEQVRDRDVQQPFVTQIPHEAVVWATTF